MLGGYDDMFTFSLRVTFFALAGWQPHIQVMDL